jgi:hypothetical protein
MTLEFVEVINKKRGLKGQISIDVPVSSFVTNYEFDAAHRLQMDFSQSFGNSFRLENAYEKRKRFLMIKKLETDYVLDNAYEVKKFLNENSFLISVLREAPSRIQKFFGYCKLKLEYFKSPDERHGELAIVIQSPFTTEENFKIQYELVKEWFAKLPVKIRERLNLEIEPVTVWGS